MTVTETNVADETKNGTTKHERNKAKNKRVNSNSANWEKIVCTKEIKGDNCHDADDGCDKKAADFFTARMSRKDIFRIKT